MAVNNSDYLLQQIVNKSNDTVDGLSAIRELLAESLKNDKKKNNGGGNPSPGDSSGPSGGGRGSRGNSSSMGKMFRAMSSEMTNVGKTMMSTSANVSTVINSMGMSASSVAGSLSMIPGPVGMAASAFKMVADVGMAVYNVMNAQLEMYNRVNSAGVSLAEGYGSLLKGSGSALMSMDLFSEVISTHSDVIAQLDGSYGDGVKEFGKLLGVVQNAQDKLGLYGMSQKTLSDLAARNIKIQKQFGGAELVRNINQAQSTQELIKTMSTFSKTMGMSIDELLKKTQSLDKSFDARILKTTLNNWVGLSEETATLTTKALTEAAGGMGDMGTDFLRLISHRISIGGVPDDLLSPMISEFADLGENMVKSGVTDAKAIREAQYQWVKKNRKRVEKDMEDMQRSQNFTAAAFAKQMLDMEAAINADKNRPADKIAEFTDRLNRWVSTEFVAPFNKMYADVQNNVVDYLTAIADRTDSAWGFIWELAKDGFGLVPIFKDAVAYVDRVGNEFVLWLEGLGADIFGDTYTQVSKAFDDFMKNLMDLPGKLWDKVKGWFGSDDKSEKQEEPKKKIEEKATSFWDSIGNSVDDFTKFVEEKTLDFQKWKSSKLYTPPRPFNVDNAYRVLGYEPPKNVQTTVMPNTPPMMELTRKHYDKSAWKPGEAPFPPEPDRDIKSLVTPQNGTINNDMSSEEIKEIFKRLAEMSEQSLAATNQTNNYLRTISENTQGERNS
ncbi:hypothetical protein FOI42_RS01835 [Escherichia coli]|nr:hypothetical protein [Escherichia coli]